MNGPKIKPPAHLSKEAKAWWRKLQDGFGIDDDGGLWVLQTACEAYQRMSEAKAILDKDGLTITDRHGQTKVHPLCAVERDARSAMLAAIKALSLDIEPLRDGPGRPAGR